MGRPKNPIPSYRLHKPSGQAVATVDGHDHYLGPHDSPASRVAYGALIAAISGGQPAPEPAKDEPRVVDDLVRPFWEWVKTYYVKHGEQTDEVDCYRSAIRPLRKLYAETPISDFGPLKLRAVRDAMIRKGWSRGFINKSVGRLRKMFRWGVSHELVAAEILTALEAVEPLLAGRTVAPDLPPRGSVSDEHIEAVRRRVKPRTRDMIDLMRLTGVRPGELVRLTTGMIDRSGDVWRCEMKSHKTEHHGKVRRIYFGASAQMILNRHLKADPDARLFPMKRATFSGLIKDACKRAKIPKWTPHWLRHTTATKVRAQHGIEDAQVLLGHASPDMTAIYSKEQDERAIALVRQIG